jgi:hypothetical protein
MNVHRGVNATCCCPLLGTYRPHRLMDEERRNDPASLCQSTFDDAVLTIPVRYSSAKTKDLVRGRDLRQHGVTTLFGPPSANCSR